MISDTLTPCDTPLFRVVSVTFLTPDTPTPLWGVGWWCQQVLIAGDGLTPWKAF